MSLRRYIQDKLLSGVNIKTINGNSLLGSGNLSVGGGSFSGDMDDIPDGTTYVKTENNYTDAEVSKLAGIASGAEVNVNADWNAVSGDAQILNKPTISGSNTGDQTSIVGISGTKANFDTACSDGNFVFQGDALGTPSSGDLTNCTFPTLNQNTTGTAANITGTSNTTLTTITTLTKTGNARVNRAINTNTTIRTITGTEIVNGTIFELTGTTTRQFTFDTGTNISTAAGGSTVGDTFTVYIKCSGTSTGTITLAGATGATLQSSAAIAIGTMRTCLVRCTGTNTWVIY